MESYAYRHEDKDGVLLSFTLSIFVTAQCVQKKYNENRFYLGQVCLVYLLYRHIGFQNRGRKLVVSQSCMTIAHWL